MIGRPLHRIASAIGQSQKAALELMRQLQADGLVEPVGSTERFWRLTDATQSKYGVALRALDPIEERAAA